MSKFHINKHGVPAICKAQKGNCPLGGNESHFDTKEEAQTFADKNNEQQHGLLPGIGNQDNSNKDKRVRVKMELLEEGLSAGKEWTEEDSYKIRDLQGKERWVSEINYYGMKKSGIIAEEGEDVYATPPENYEKADTDKKRVIDQESVNYGVNDDIDYTTNYRVMDSDGNAEWIDTANYHAMQRNGMIAEKEEIFNFPTEPNEIEEKSSVMDRVKGLFRR